MLDTTTVNLTHHFLIAMPAMEDPNFARTLTYIAEHNDQGALGIIVNRPIDMTVSSLFERIQLSLTVEDVGAQPIYFGGPVQTDRGFVLHRPVGSWHSTLSVQDEVGLTSSRDILQSIGDTGFPSEMLISLGYTGWAAGQLEQEILDNAWLTLPADMSIIFNHPPEARLGSALQKLGVNLVNLSETAGHA